MGRAVDDGPAVLPVRGGRLRRVGPASWPPCRSCSACSTRASAVLVALLGRRAGGPARRLGGPGLRVLLAGRRDVPADDDRKRPHAAAGRRPWSRCALAPDRRRPRAACWPGGGRGVSRSGSPRSPAPAAWPSAPRCGAGAAGRGDGGGPGAASCVRGWRWPRSSRPGRRASVGRGRPVADRERVHLQPVGRQRAGRRAAAVAPGSMTWPRSRRRRPAGRALYYARQRLTERWRQLPGEGLDQLPALRAAGGAARCCWRSNNRGPLAPRWPASLLDDLAAAPRCRCSSVFLAGRAARRPRAACSCCGPATTCSWWSSSSTTRSATAARWCRSCSPAPPGGLALLGRAGGPPPAHGSLAGRLAAGLRPWSGRDARRRAWAPARAGRPGVVGAPSPRRKAARAAAAGASRASAPRPGSIRALAGGGRPVPRRRCEAYREAHRRDRPPLGAADRLPAAPRAGGPARGSGRGRRGSQRLSMRRGPLARARGRRGASCPPPARRVHRWGGTTTAPSRGFQRPRRTATAGAATGPGCASSPPDTAPAYDVTLEMGSPEPSPSMPRRRWRWPCAEARSRASRWAETCRPYTLRTPAPADGVLLVELRAPTWNRLGPSRRAGRARGPDDGRSRPRVESAAPRVRRRRGLMNRKVTVVGGGNVGATLAQRLADRELCRRRPHRHRRRHAAGQGPRHHGGHARRRARTPAWWAPTTTRTPRAPTSWSSRPASRASPGMSRDDLLNTNYKIVRECTEQALKHSPDAILIVVSNPLDAMCQVAYKVSGLPRQRVFGMAGVLDSARMRDLHRHGAGRVRREHPRLRAGRARRHHGAAAALLDGGRHPDHRAAAPERVDAIVKRTANGGAEIVALLKTGSAYYAPSASTAEMVDAVLKDKHKVLPCCCYLEGEFGIKDLYVGVPAQLGREGRREDLGDQAHRRRAGRAPQVRRRGEGAGGRPEDLTGAPARRQAVARSRNRRVTSSRSAGSVGLAR